MAAFEAIVTRLAQDRGRVFVFAQINSAPVAAWLALHLNMCRPGVHELGAGAVTAIDQLPWVQPDDVLLVFSIRRYANGPVKVAQRFREVGGQVLAITDSATAPLTPLGTGAHVQRLTVRLVHGSVLPLQRTSVDRGAVAARERVGSAGTARCALEGLGKPAHHGPRTACSTFPQGQSNVNVPRTHLAQLMTAC